MPCSSHTRRSSRARAACRDMPHVLNRRDELAGPARSYGRVFAPVVTVMPVGRGARYRGAAAAIALLLLAGLVPCLLHMEGSGPDDLCLSFGPLTGPGVVHQLLPAGQSAPP
jgi:hypothetical protein